MRLDLYLVEKYKLKSRTFALNLIKKGKVKIDGAVADKPSAEVDDNVEIEIDTTAEFESLGGDKLEKALNVFQLDVVNKTAVDIGASNGGFTDCLLKFGAKKVFAVDVAECAFSDKLKRDSRVIIRDRLNARELVFEDISEYADIITIDVSFISIKYILKPASVLLKPDGYIIALIKPQFELGHRAGKSGIVVDKKERLEVLNKVLEYANSIGLYMEAICAVPNNFKNKNIEYTIKLSLEKTNNTINRIRYSDFLAIK